MSTSLELTTLGIHYQNNIMRSEDEFVNGTRTSDPRIHTRFTKDRYLQRWNKIILVLCLLALNCDPLFFYIQVINAQKQCITFDDTSRVIAISLRTSTDLFYLLHIFLKLYIRLGLSSSRLSLTDHPTTIANTYLSFYFIIVDILAVLPLPQMVVTVPIDNMFRVIWLSSKRLLHLVIFFQWIPRVMRIYPLHKEVKKTSGLITDSMWGGAIFNLFLYMSASHVVGALWYFFSIDRMVRCWHKSCTQGCHDKPSLYCHIYDKQHVVNYNFNSTYCNFLDSDHAAFNFGLFIDALKSKVVQSNQLLRKIPYCFWWGLRNLSSCGQNLQTSTFFWEIAFATAICVVGLSLFALLFGNIQKYLQMLLSTSHRENDMRERRQDIEQWMCREKLPNVIRRDIRRLEEFKWQKTRGFDEQSFFTTLPRELRFVIKKHQCSEVVKKIPMFTVLNNTLLKEIVRDLLKPLFYTEDSLIIQEGDFVNEMILIKSGRICDITIRSNGEPHDEVIRDFCGEELIMWALDPFSQSNLDLPISTRTIKTHDKGIVEAFSLLPHDLKFIALEFRKQVRHEFREIINQHLDVVDFVKKVLRFCGLDKEMCNVDLKSAVYDKNKSIIREGEFVNKMMFIKSGRICVTAKNNEILNSVILEAGDFCGEEWIMWALDHYQRRRSNLPISTKTVQTQTQVETLELFQNMQFVSPNNNLIVL